MRKGLLKGASVEFQVTADLTLTGYSASLDPVLMGFVSIQPVPKGGAGNLVFFVDAPPVIGTSARLCGKCLSFRFEMWQRIEKSVKPNRARGQGIRGKAADLMGSL